MKPIFELEFHPRAFLFCHFDSRGGTHLRVGGLPFDALTSYFETFTCGEPETDIEYIGNLQETVLANFEGVKALVAPKGVSFAPDTELLEGYGGEFSFWWLHEIVSKVESRDMNILVMLPSELIPTDVQNVDNGFGPDYEPHGLVIEDIRQCLIRAGFAYLDNPRYRGHLALLRAELGEDAFGVLAF